MVMNELVNVLPAPPCHIACKQYITLNFYHPFCHDFHLYNSCYMLSILTCASFKPVLLSSLVRLGPVGAVVSLMRDRLVSRLLR